MICKYHFTRTKDQQSKQLFLKFHPRDQIQHLSTNPFLSLDQNYGISSQKIALKPSILLKVSNDILVSLCQNFKIYPQQVGTSLPTQTRCWTGSTQDLMDYDGAPLVSNQGIIAKVSVKVYAWPGGC